MQREDRHPWSIQHLDTALLGALLLMMWVLSLVILLGYLRVQPILDNL